jgi:hypothetical protein
MDLICLINIRLERAVMDAVIWSTKMLGQSTGNVTFSERLELQAPIIPGSVLIPTRKHYSHLQ